MKQKKMLVMIGSFDPWTNGHSISLKSALSVASFDKIVIVPVGDHYKHKPDLKPFNTRMCIISDTLKREGYTQDIEISMLENMYPNLDTTYKTLSSLSYSNPGYTIVLTVGSDVAKQIPEWEDGQFLLNEYYVIVTRRNKEDEEIDYPGVEYIDLAVPNNFSSTIVREHIKAGKISEMMYNYRGIVDVRILPYLSQVYGV